MVYFYESQPELGYDGYQVIIGKDKFENDLLIKYGYRELNYMWFHADKYSSGHVYLKMKESEKSLGDVPKAVVEDCLQLCKSESIQGNKMPECTIIYTAWHNLRKNRYMKPGEVSFKSVKNCKKTVCYNRDNKILNRLSKTRVEIYDDVEKLLHEAKKSKDPNYFTDYISRNRDSLVEAEKVRKQLSKLAKQKKKKETEEEFYNN